MTWLRATVRGLDPGYFALVMATCIVSRAMQLDGAAWVGVILYLLVAGLVTAARLAFPVRPAEVAPAYWVFMGASAISVLAGVSVMLWAFGTWLVPFLVILGVWRHVRHRVPLG